MGTIAKIKLEAINGRGGYECSAMHGQAVIDRYRSSIPCQTMYAVELYHDVHYVRHGAKVTYLTDFVGFKIKSMRLKYSKIFWSQWGYIIGFCLLLGSFSMLFLTLLDLDFLMLIVCLLVLLLSVFLMVASIRSYKRATSVGVPIVREQFYQALGYAIMPEWLMEEQFAQLYSALEERMTQLYGERDWKSQLGLLNEDDERFAATFSYAYMSNVKNNNLEANQQLMERLAPRKVSIISEIWACLTWNLPWVHPTFR